MTNHARPALIFQDLYILLPGDANRRRYTLRLKSLPRGIMTF